MRFKKLQCKQKGQTLIFLLIGILILAVVAGGIYYLGTKNKTLSETISEQNPVVLEGQITEPNNKPSPDASTLNKDETANWKTYTNTDYGFSFKYPNSWTVAEQPNHIFIITDDNSELSVGYKKINDTVRIVRTGVGAGDISIKGIAKFFNQKPERNVLNFRGKDKSVLYNNAGEMTTKNLVFSISLNSSSPRVSDYGKNYEDELLSLQTQNMADQILSTFQFTQ